jgi:hypothetical protein
VSVTVRPYEPAADERWATGFLEEHLGGRRQARRGEIIDVLAPGLGLVAGDASGLLAYRVDDDGLELTAIAARPSGQGTGRQHSAQGRLAAASTRPRRVPDDNNAPAGRVFVTEAAPERASSSMRA